jgi:ABC-2 type transport system permease protein
MELAMNIFIRELRAGLKSLLIWAGCVALLIAGIMGKYSGLSENDRQINELVAKMPKAVQVFVGGGAFDFTDISGYVGVTLGYIMLIASLFAVILGSNTVSREERDKTAEFLMTKPVKRWRVIVIKLTASFCILLAFTALTFAVTAGFTSAMEHESGLTGKIAVMFAALLMVEWLFMGLGAMTAAAKNPRRAGRAGLSIAFGCYLISLAILLYEEIDFLRPLTPFAYFDLAAVIEGAGLNALYTCVSVILGGIFLALSVILGRRRDIQI